MSTTTHLIVPDTQCKKGVPLDHMDWIGRYILERRPDVIVHLGDLWDMPSLSSYDKGKLQMEGRRYRDDVAAGNKALTMLDRPTQKYNRLRRNGHKYRPRKILLRGNHEYRIQRAVEDSPQLEGQIGYGDLNTRDWEVYDYLEPVFVDGIAYCHVFVNPMTGRPLGGMISTRLKALGHSFTMGHQQTLDAAVRVVHGPDGPTMQRGLVAGSCLTPDHRVLTADLDYVQLGDLEVGDKLVAFDEDIRGRRSRRYRTGEVQALRFEDAETWRVTLESGKQFRVTPDHLWLTRVGGPMAVRQGATYMWRRTDQLRRGTLIPRPLDEWDELRTHEADYLAGMYDGEGCYYTRTTTAGQVCQLSLSQKPGVVLDRTIAALLTVVDTEALGHLNCKGVEAIRLRGGAPAIARLLGQVRPTRLLAKFQPHHLGGMTTARNDRVVDIEPIGVQEILRIAVDAKTMIVEGYPHHNCYLHHEEYLGYQGNAHWRGVIVKHEVENGSYDLMEVSMNYLCRKYTGLPLREFMLKNYPEYA